MHLRRNNKSAIDPKFLIPKTVINGVLVEFPRELTDEEKYEKAFPKHLRGTISGCCDDARNPAPIEE